VMGELMDVQRYAYVILRSRVWAQHLDLRRSVLRRVMLLLVLSVGVGGICGDCFLARQKRMRSR